MAAMAAAAAAGGMAVAGSGQVPAMPASSWLGSGTRKSLGALRGFRAASSASSCSGSELRRAPPAQFVRSQENGRGRTRALDTSTAASAAASGTLLSSDGECAIGFLLSLLWAGDFGLCILGEFADWFGSAFSGGRLAFVLGRPSVLGREIESDIRSIVDGSTLR